MTVNDPIYTVTITNESAGWSYSTTQGDAFDPAEPVQLGDGLTMSWGFAGGDMWSMLEVEQISCALYVAESADLPDCEQGHILTVHLDRGPGIPYMHFAGRITDVSAETHPQYGAIVTLLASDPTSELTANHPSPEAFGAYAPVDYQVGNAVDLYYKSGAYAYNSTPGFGSMIDAFEGKLSDFIARTLAGTPAPGLGALNLRYAYGWVPGPPDWTTSPPADPPSPWTFYTQLMVAGRVSDGFTAPYTYAFDPDDADRVTIEYDPDAIGGDALTVLDGDFVGVPQTWRKDRSTSPNKVGYNVWHYNMVTEELTAETLEVRNQEAIDEFGVVPHDLDTLLFTDPNIADPPPQPGEALLEAVPPPGNWSADSVVVLPELAPDDATLDVLATQFYPHSQPTDSVLGRAVVVTNISPNILLSELFHYAVIVGCTFTVNGGKLRIVPQLQPVAVRVDPAAAPGPSYDEFGASAYGNATYDDQGGATDYIDPDLTYDQLKLAAL